MPGAGRAPIHWNMMSALHSQFSQSGVSNPEMHPYHRRRSSFGATSRATSIVADKCTLCWDETIGPANAAQTFRFNCGHAFCVLCTMEHLEPFIQNLYADKVCCLMDGCNVKATKEQLNILFIGQDDMQ